MPCSPVPDPVFRLAGIIDPFAGGNPYLLALLDLPPICRRRLVRQVVLLCAAIPAAFAAGRPGAFGESCPLPERERKLKRFRKGFIRQAIQNILNCEKRPSTASWSEIQGIFRPVCARDFGDGGSV